MALLEKSTKHIKNVHQSFSSYFKRLRSRERSQSHFVKPPSPCDQNQTKTTKKNIGSQCLWIYGRPDNSAGEKSTCNAGDPSLISGLGGSPGEGIGYPLRYSWASLVAQLVKNLLVILETWIRSLGWERPLEKGRATHFSILAWRILWNCEESDMTERLSLHLWGHVPLSVVPGSEMTDLFFFLPSFSEL